MSSIIDVIVLTTFVCPSDDDSRKLGQDSVEG
jgi:hypothetical protein